MILCLACSNFLSAQNAEKIYKKVNDAVVTIYTYHSDKSVHGFGSGVVIKSKGWIITNFHLVGDGDSLLVKHGEKTILHKGIIGMDATKDILILKADESDFPSVTVGNSDALKVGEKVYAIGSPLGYENTITEGIISGFRKNAQQTGTYIQISAPISPGSSGGAVLNDKGELIGISSYTTEGAQYINFAIPINDVLNVPVSAKPYTFITQFSTSDYFQLGQNEDKIGHYGTAINYYLHAINSEINEIAYMYYLIGSAYINIGYRDSALTSFKSAIHLNPGYSNAYMGLGLVYYNNQEYDSALNNLDIALKYNPENINAKLLTGYIAYEIKKYDIAIEIYNDVIQGDPGYAEAYLGLSKCYQAKGDYTTAMQYQQKAYQLNPLLRNQK